jgi:hypothetical protein
MKQRKVTLALLLLLSASAVFVYTSLTSTAEGRNIEPQRRAPQRRRGAARPAQRNRPRVDYSRFSHRTAAHKQSCNSCHTNPTPNWSRARAGDAAFPDVTDYPEHQSCMNCHKQQFFVGARPVICTVCHTNVSPRDGRRHPFRNPSENFEAGAAKKPKSESQFAINFPHDRHQDVMALLRMPPSSEPGFGFARAAFVRQEKARAVDSCSICHQTYQPQGDPKNDEFVLPRPENLPDNDLRIKAFWLKKGTLKTTPASHASCFNCHWQDGGESPLSSDCAGCHKLLPATTAASLLGKPSSPDADLAHPSAKGIADREVLEHWARRKTATFRHEEGSHSEVGCTTCHVNITAVNKLDADTLDVPIQTCAACHGAARAPRNIILREVEQRKKPDGASYQCIKCHLNYGKEPTPKSHLDLFPPPKPK